VFLVTLSGSAAHAGGVTVSSCERRPHTLKTTCAPRLLDPQGSQTQTGLVTTAHTALTVLLTLKPQHENDALAAQGMRHALSAAATPQCAARDRDAFREPSLVYALYPRPPTWPARAGCAAHGTLAQDREA